MTNSTLITLGGIIIAITGDMYLDVYCNFDRTCFYLVHQTYYRKEQGPKWLFEIINSFVNVLNLLFFFFTLSHIV